MSHDSVFAVSDAFDEQRLHVFKDFWREASAAERKKLAEYVNAVSALSPGELDEGVQFAAELGCRVDRAIGVNFYCSFSDEGELGPSATVDPHLLRHALAAWERGEPFIQQTLAPAAEEDFVSSWRLGDNHSDQQWQNKMQARGWTSDQITEAIQSGQPFAATNNVHPGNGATRYVHPTTGRSVVVDDTTGEVIHVGGDGYVY